MTIRLWNPETEPDLPARTETPTVWILTEEHLSFDAASPAMDCAFDDRHLWVVVDPPEFLPTKHEPGSDNIIPAVRVPPLSAIEPLLRVQAKRRAVVVECGERIYTDSFLRCPLCCYTRADQAMHLDHRICEARGGQIPGINLVILVAPADTSLGHCPGCRPKRVTHHGQTYEHPEYRPWDIATAIDIAAQCRAAGVPVVACGEVGRAHETADIAGASYRKALAHWPAEIPTTLPDWGTP